MSGPICPDCGSFDIESIGDMDRCGFCGWRGPPRPRRTLTPETQRRLAEQNRANKEAKEAGRLFFLRIYGEDTNALNGIRDDLEPVLDGLESSQVRNADPPYIFVKLSAKPGEAIIDKIKTLPGVTGVKVH